MAHRPRRPAPGLLLCGILGAAALASCSQRDLQAIDDVQLQRVDDLLEVSGEVCTPPPAQADFPVKVLFIIDGSGSMQFIDAPGRRALAVEEVILRLRPNPSVSFGVIRFNEANVVLTKPGSEITATDPFGADLSGAFTRDPAVLREAVQGLRVSDSVTDYQGALSAAFRLLSQDMLATAPAELARSKYVILFLSDGDPFPECCSRQSEQAGLCTRSTNIFFCEDPDAIRQNPTQLPFLAGGEDYNQPYQIYGAVRDIMDLTRTFPVGELRMHTAFLFDDSLVDSLDPRGCYVVAGVNFVCVEEARELLSTMARLGDGVFRDFSRAEEIDFLGFDLSSIKRENALKSLIVTSESLLLEPEGLAVDSDGDGLPDAVEFALGLNRLDRDTDGDGYGDLFEVRMQRQGFDPLRPDPGCMAPADRRDVDGDGLLRCEELVLRTSPDLVDSDADGLPDGVELRAGTDPARADALEDLDRDGVRNGDEIRAGTSVRFDEGSARPGFARRYRTRELGANDAGERCYAFEVKNLRLGTPLARAGAESYGRNDILVWAAAAPSDDPRDFGEFQVACVRARHVAPDFKDPPTGKVVLKPEDFHAPDALDRDRHCVGLGGLEAAP